MINVTAAILVKNNKILIAQRKATDHLSGKWEFPGGKVETDETPEECLIRELFEEFKIEAKIEKPFMTSKYKYSENEIELISFIVSVEEYNINPLFHNQIKWVKISEIGEYDFAPADIPIINKIISSFDK